jgi:hypothetical protein
MLGKALGRGIYWNLAHTWLHLVWALTLVKPMALGFTLHLFASYNIIKVALHTWLHLTWAFIQVKPMVSCFTLLHLNTFILVTLRPFIIPIGNNKNLMWNYWTHFITIFTHILNTFIGTQFFFWFYNFNYSLHSRCVHTWCQGL